MKKEGIGGRKIIMSNPGSRHCYFGWPTVAKLQNGKIAVVASGFRLSHICPFGKAVIAYSEDNGETYTAPSPVIDTVLDDRDAGILPFGEKNVIVTSFNNRVAFQRKHADPAKSIHTSSQSESAYRNAYLDLVTPEEEAAVLGATFRISTDCGVTFGPLHISPVTSPHGPAVLQDGTILWVGQRFSKDNVFLPDDRIEAWEVHMDGTMAFRGAIDNVWFEGEKLDACEPHTVQLDNGTLICHIRMARYTPNHVFTTYQSVSNDGGYTWSTPRPLLEVTGGAPAHLLKLSSGILLSVYGYREAPYGIRYMYSMDNGNTWVTDQILTDTEKSGDLGYPSTVELEDGTLLTVYYTRLEENGPAVIAQQKWTLRPED